MRRRRQQSSGRVRQRGAKAAAAGPGNGDGDGGVVQTRSGKVFILQFGREKEARRWGVMVNDGGAAHARMTCPCVQLLNSHSDKGDKQFDKGRGDNIG